jgi:hypothetical protein
MVSLGRNCSFENDLKTGAIVFAILLLTAAVAIPNKFEDGMTIQSASALFDTSGNQGTNRNVTSVQNASASSLLLRGLIGSALSIQDANVTGNDGQTIHGDYAATGRWRLFVNESIVQRFVANITLAKTDGSEYHNVLIENIGRDSEFEDTAFTITAQIYADSHLPSLIVPITIEVENRVLRITDIDIDEGGVEDDQQEDILRIIDGQSIYGIVESQETM